MGNTQAWMKRTAEAKTGGNRDANLEPGDYRLKLIGFRAFQNRKTKSDCLLYTFSVLSSNNERHPVGTWVSWYVDYAWDGTPGDVKRFTAAVNDCSVEEVSDEVIAATYEDDAKAIIGTDVFCHAYVKDGKTFTKTEWRLVPTKS